MKLETITGQVEIAAERFDLRPLRRSDAGLIGLYAGDARLARNTSSIPHPLPPGAAEAFIARACAADRTEDIWAIDGSKTDGSEVMGVISLAHAGDRRAELSYWVAQPYWNTGIATAAIRALIDANPRDSDTFFATVFQDNPASARVLTKLGFRYLGDAETFSVARAAKVATWTYSLKLD